MTLTTSSSTSNKRTIKRLPASCSACRLLWPCSECDKRNWNCDYEDARAPIILSKRNRNDLNEQQEYIQKLEAKIEALEKSRIAPLPNSGNVKTSASSNQAVKSVPTSNAKIDLATDDLANQLSRITLGPRLRAYEQRYPLETELETLVARAPERPQIAPLIPNLTFKMNLITNRSPPSIKDLQALLPPFSEAMELSDYYIQSINLWMHCIDPKSWREEVRRCYPPNDPHQFTFEDVHRLAAVLAVVAHGLLQRTSHHPNMRGQAQVHQIARADQWFHSALGALTQPDRGEILTHPTIWGIRAMTLLGNVDLS
ncbi:hypothetical protein CROQUDRAFT_668746 [Cronartium quercuum f. sp. fusiforme G11]|uniref:Zn(2)-C6 fungal-type domain-containing protein n=1 Tax=Cronartium quercuum f. sp. fusiforme G11 TaxID=708437 RepID=A0A9P6NQC8_9BASI|nr:hypothetical protein CROQUDRAFT_668746 [Cronartium quercuum f. sp. fusiforme G11]